MSYPASENRYVEIINKCTSLLEQEDESFKDVFLAMYKSAVIDTNLYNELLIYFMNKCTTTVMIDLVLNTFVMEFQTKMSNFALSLETSLFMFETVKDEVLQLLIDFTGTSMEEHLTNLVNWDASEECITAAYRVKKIYALYDLPTIERLLALIDKTDTDKFYSNDKMLLFLQEFKGDCITYVDEPPERLKDFNIRLSNYVSEKDKEKIGLTRNKSRKAIGGTLSLISGSGKVEDVTDDTKRLPFEWELYSIKWKIEYNGFIKRDKLEEVLKLNMIEGEVDKYLDYIYSILDSLEERGYDIHNTGNGVKIDIKKILTFETLTKEERLALKYLNDMYISETVGLIDDEELFRIYGPANPHNNVSFLDKDICSKFGGCRMLTCCQFEMEDLDESEIDTTQENQAFWELWWTNAKGKCLNCYKPILKKCAAVRQPILGGGWKGCYCKVECMLEQVAFYGLETPSILHDGLVQRMIIGLQKIGIQDRIHSNTPDFSNGISLAGVTQTTNSIIDGLNVANLVISTTSIDDKSISKAPVEKSAKVVIYESDDDEDIGISREEYKRMMNRRRRRDLTESDEE